MKMPRAIALVLLLLPSLSRTQENEFNISAYQEFLLANENLDTEQLLNIHPGGLFSEGIKSLPRDVQYLDSMRSRLDLTPDEEALLLRQGLVVTERLARETFLEQFAEIWRLDLPVFISADAILHAFHEQYDYILRTIELSLADLLEDMLGRMQRQLPGLAAKYAAYPEITTMLRDVDVYLTVPLRLLGQSAAASTAVG